MVLVNLYTMDTLMVLVRLYTMDALMVLVNLYTRDTLMVLVNLNYRYTFIFQNTCSENEFPLAATPADKKLISTIRYIPLGYLLISQQSDRFR